VRLGVHSHLLSVAVALETVTRRAHLVVRGFFYDAATMPRLTVPLRTSPLHWGYFKDSNRLESLTLQQLADFLVRGSPEAEGLCADCVVQAGAAPVQ